MHRSFDDAQATVFTRMPSLAYSMRVRAWTACKLPLPITWTAPVRLRSGWSTEAVDTLTMLPLFRCNIRSPLTVKVEKAEAS